MTGRRVVTATPRRSDRQPGFDRARAVPGRPPRGAARAAAGVGLGLSLIGSGVGLGLTLASGSARADINLLAPSRVIDPGAPFKLTLLITGEDESRSYALPEVLRVTLTPDLGAVARLELRQVVSLPPQIDLKRGEFLRVEYVGEVPGNLRGRVRIDAVDLDTPPMIVQLSTAAATAAAPVPPPSGSPAVPPPASPSATSGASGTAASGTAAPVPVTTLSVRSDSDPNARDEGRLSFHEPMFAVAGAGVDANAQIQLSFRLRLYEPADRTSRRVLDNLYVGYTQAAFWDLTADSKPFLDIRYVPSLFYFVPATDWRVGGNAVGLAAGIEHESNGRDGDESRSLDTLFVRPYFTFGDPADFHWTFSPKLYAYLEKSENPDIQKYRGYGDYRFTYGKNSDWQVAWTLRKGTRSSAFSSDLQATWPLNRMFPGLAGYLMAQYFAGYGETLLDYNRREPWTVRVGYAIWR